MYVHCNYNYKMKEYTTHVKLLIHSCSTQSVYPSSEIFDNLFMHDCGYIMYCTFFNFAIFVKIPVMTNLTEYLNCNTAYNTIASM